MKCSRFPTPGFAGRDLSNDSSRVDPSALGSPGQGGGVTCRGGQKYPCPLKLGILATPGLHLRLSDMHRILYTR